MEAVKLTKKDFDSGQEVRWCPGCGDYSILAAVQKCLPELGLPREKHVFVSGIGCSSRFPYYMNTYGFHTIHGRAPTIATGLKVANPELMVWVVTGDGDALSIGGNHFMHMFRRNPDLNVLLFNNRIYGLTKGQYSPTSEFGKVTKSTPLGSVDQPVNPVQIALASGATFVARSLDVDAKNLHELLKRAAAHKGTALIEIYQNCNIFNDGAYNHLSDREVRKSSQVQLVHGEPLTFGNDNEWALVQDGFTFRVVSRAEVEDQAILRYNSGNLQLANAISTLPHPEFPVPMGVFYQVSRPVLDDLVHGQVEVSKDKYGPGSLEALVRSGDVWEVDRD